MKSDDILILKSSLAFYEKMARDGVYFTPEQFQILKRSLKKEAVMVALNKCLHCGCDGEAWKSELEQISIQMGEGEL